MASESLAGGLRGLAEGSGAFANALRNLSGMQMRREQRALQNRMSEERLEMAREQNRRAGFSAALRAATTPGVNTGGTGQRIGELAGSEYFFEEPETETPTFEYRGAELPIGEEGFTTAQQIRRAVEGPGGTSGGLKLRGARSPFDPVTQPEKYREWVQNVEGPIQAARGAGQDRPAPTFGQAMENVVNPAFQSGTRMNPQTFEEEPTYSLSPTARAAKADSLATGELTIPEFARRFEDGGRAEPEGGGQQPPPRTAADTASSGEGADFPGPKPGAEAEEPWDGPATLQHWSRAAGAALDAGADEDRVRDRLQAQGLTPDQIDRVLSEAR